MKKFIIGLALIVLSVNAFAVRFSGKATDLEVDGTRVFFKVNGGMPHVNPNCTSNFRYEFIGDKKLGFALLLAGHLEERTLEFNLVETACYANYSGISAVKMK